MIQLSLTTEQAVELENALQSICQGKVFINDKVEVKLYSNAVQNVHGKLLIELNKLLKK